MRVKLEFRDKDLNVVDVQEYNLPDFCHLLSQRLLSLLYLIEDYSDGKLEFRQLRHTIFDLAGDIDRLPTYLQDSDQGENIKMKQPDKGFFNFLKRGN